LYWIAIDALLVYLFYAQQRPILALLNALFIAIAASGFIAWRRRLTTQVVPA
jgi:nicotinamide riboside transporter PnuC